MPAPTEDPRYRSGQRNKQFEVSGTVDGVPYTVTGISADWQYFCGVCARNRNYHMVRENGDNIGPLLQTRKQRWQVVEEALGEPIEQYVERERQKGRTISSIEHELLLPERTYYHVLRLKGLLRQYEHSVRLPQGKDSLVERYRLVEVCDEYES